MRIRSVVPLAVGLLPLLAAPAHADEPQLSKKLVTKVFSVAELVTPIPDLAPPPAGEKPLQLAAWKRPTAAESVEQLIRLVTSVVRPYSWETMGGPGKAEYFEIGSALVVNNTQDVVTEVTNLLEALRRLQDVSVCTEVRVLRVPTGLCAKAGMKPDATMSESELATLLAFVQAERDASVLQCPKVTTFDGQVATVRCGESREYVTGVQARLAGGQIAFIPQTTVCDLGDTLTLCGRVSADGRFVSLRANFTRTTEVGPAGGLRATAFITPRLEGGSSQAAPTPQSLRLPVLKTEACERTAVVPSGGTVVLGGWKELGAPRVVPGTPSKIPYINRLFKNAGDCPEYDVVVLATTRVVRAEPVAVAPTPRAAPVAEQRLSQVIRLQHIGAADGVAAVSDSFGLKIRDAVLVAEPVSNTVLVSADEPLHREVVKRLSALDAPPPQVHVQALVVRAPAGFLSDAGLATDGKALVLTPRELNMLTAHIRKEKKNGLIGIQSRPQLQLTDNQTGFVQVGGGNQAVVTSLEITAGPNGPVVTPKTTDFDCGLRLRVTPRTNPNAEVLLRVEGSWSPGYDGPLTPVTLPPAVTGLKEPVTFHLATGAVRAYGFETTAKVPDGHTVVIRAGVCEHPGCDGDGPIAAMVKRCGFGDGELLVLLTPHVVRAEAATPAAHTEPAAPKPAVAPKPIPAVMPPLGYGRHGSEPYPRD